MHRDLKPENIFVTKEGHAKILDFGLAKLTEVAVAASPGGRAGATSVAGRVPGAEAAGGPSRSPTAWNETGLYYDASGDWMRVENTATDGGFAPGRRELLMTSLLEWSGLGRNYDIAADVSGVLIPRAEPNPESQARQLNVAINWLDELERLVPDGRTRPLSRGESRVSGD